MARGGVEQHDEPVDSQGQDLSLQDPNLREFSLTFL
jgi:hypothetical protein